jgi:hypothetical protein
MYIPVLFFVLKLNRSGLLVVSAPESCQYRPEKMFQHFFCVDGSHYVYIDGSFNNLCVFITPYWILSKI